VSAPEFDAKLLAYFASREQQRQAEIDQAWDKLQADIAGFLERYATHEAMPFAVAKLVREMTVAAFVRGTMWAAGKQFHELEQPTDSTMLHQARETVTAMPDIYKTWALLDGRIEDGGET
jgi:hypothetical protein